MHIRALLYIALGGGIGSVLRYLSIQLIQKNIETLFPLGTLCVNTLGALVIGFVFNTFQTHIIPMELRLLLITGFLGGYTTFSAYSLETVQRLLNGDITQALLNILVSNAVCLLFVFLGIWLSKKLVTIY
jgi:CrcB protein